MTFALSTAASLILKAAEGSQATVNTLSMAGKDVIGAQASAATEAGFLPIQVAFVVMGCLMVSGFVLLLRESRIEQRDSRRRAR